MSTNKKENNVKKLIYGIVGMLTFQAFYWYMNEVELWFVPLIMVANFIALKYVYEGN